MQERIMEMLASAAAELGINVNPRYTYEGRLTTGKETHALAMPGLGELLAIVAEAAANNALASLHYPVEYTPESFAAECLKFRRDYLENAIVIY